MFDSYPRTTNKVSISAIKRYQDLNQFTKLYSHPKTTECDSSSYDIPKTISMTITFDSKLVSTKNMF